jgi:hypothetical protein
MADGQLTRSPHAVVITSTDGGARWVRHEVPASLQRYMPQGQIVRGRGVLDHRRLEQAALHTQRWKELLAAGSAALVCQTCEQTGADDVTFVNGSDGYAAGEAGGVGLAVTPQEGAVWKTTDGGAHWTMAIQGLPAVEAISCIDSNHCWAAAATSTTGEMYGTADGGNHWSHQAVPRFRGFFNDIRCERTAQEDRCFAVGENLGETAPVIASTIDGGYLWSLDREPKGTGPLSQAAFVGSAGRAAGHKENREVTGVILAS